MAALLETALDKNNWHIVIKMKQKFHSPPKLYQTFDVSSNKALKSFPLILNQSKIIEYFAIDRSISLTNVKPDQI